MRQRSRVFIALFALLALFANKSFGQYPGQVYTEKIANYVYSSDSVAGFDEQAASAGALANASYGLEYKVFMYWAKRTYVKQKFNLRTAPPVAVTLFQNQMNSKTSQIGGSCNNEDFELATTSFSTGTIQGWTPSSGSNSGQGCNPPTLSGAGLFTVYVSSVIDPIMNAQVASYFGSSNVVPGGNAFIRLNDQPGGSTVSRLSKSFIVTPANALYEYAYLPVIQNGDHTCCSQAGFAIQITITNTATSASSVLACPQISVAVPSNSCNFVPPAGSPTFVAAPATGWLYHPWAASAIDLTQYIGMQVTLDVTARDCDQGGHAGYVYFDSKCAPMAIVGNNNSFPAGTPNITLPTCGAQSATICAPDGLGPYTWAGPNVVAPYNTPLNSNQCFTTSISADYTLSMNPPGSCNPIDRVVTVTITAAPYILINANQAVCGATSAVITYTAAGSASVNPVITWSPTPTSTTSSAVNLGTATFSAGVGVVTVTALDPLGCLATATVNILPSPPVPTVAILNVTGTQTITCTTPSIDLSAVSGYTFGTLNYYWSSNSFTSSAQDVNVTSASTLITLTVSDPVTGCVKTATTSIQVNTVIPISSVNPVSQTIGCGPGVVATATGIAVSPSINVTHYWYFPGSPIPYSTGGPISIVQPITGTSTFVLVNDINGCSTTKTVEVISNGGTYPTFDLTSVTNFTLGCGTSSLSAITITNGQVPPNGGAVSYTVLPPTFIGPSYGFTSNITYTLNSPGIYTVIVKSNNNACETRLPVSIIQNTFAPNVGYTASTQTLDCITPSVTLMGTSTDTAPVSYLWKSNGNPNTTVGYSVTVNTTTAGASVASGTVIDHYTLTVTDQNNNCTNTMVVTVYQNTRPPVASIGGSSTLTCLYNNINLSNISSTGILPGSFSIAQPIIGLLWEGPTPQQPKPNSSSYAAFTPGIYTLTARDENNGCTSKTTTPVYDGKVYPVLSTNTLVALDCGASATGGVKLPVTVVGLPASAVTAQWNVPVPSPNVQGLQTLTLTTDGIGEYNLVVTTNSNSCQSQIFVNVVNGKLNANFTADQQSGYAPLTVNFTNLSSSTSSVNGTSSITTVWSFGNGTTKTTSLNSTPVSAIYNQAGTYTVTMFASKGTCLDTAFKIITVDIPSKLEVPNVFTPNGDNSNDLFFLKTANLTNITALIYDRWGNKVYELSTDKGNIAWDGKNQSGKEAPDGTYFYIIKATGKDGQSYDTKGNVSLYR